MIKKTIPLLLSLFLVGSAWVSIYGQRPHGYNPFNDRTIFYEFKKEDSLDGLYINDNLLKIYTDTLPLFTTDETDGWRETKLVRYFYDSANSLKRISFRDGGTGYYYFYFDGPFLKKARFVKQKDRNIIKYYFTVEDNSYTIAQIEYRVTQEPAKKEFFAILKMGKDFLEKFKTLL